MRLAIAIVALCAGTAAADPTGTPEPEPGYPFQTAAVDSVTLVAGLVGGLEADATNGVVKNPAFVAIAAFCVGAPLVHAVHGHGARAAGSLVLRIVGTATAAALTYRFYPHGDDAASLEAAATGALVAGAGIAVFDAFVLARGDERPSRTWSPTVGANAAGWTVGVGGSF